LRSKFSNVLLAVLGGIVLFLAAAHVYTSLTNYDRFVLLFGRSYATDVARSAHVALLILGWAWIAARIGFTGWSIVASGTTFTVGLAIALGVSARTNQDAESVLQYDLGAHAWWITLLLTGLGALLAWRARGTPQSSPKRLALLGGASLVGGVILYALRLHGPVGMLCKVALVLLLTPWSFLAAAMSKGWSGTQAQSMRWGFVIIACLVMSLFGFLRHG
jgi:hypothetical protein